MVKRKFVVIPIVIGLCALLLLCSCGIMGRNRIPHPPVATAVPDFSEDITDIRISAATCEEYELDFSNYKNFRNLTLLQILYGYYSDGEWHDVPAESYDYVGIFNGSSGMGGTSDSHIVKIGHYLLVCFEQSYYESNFETTIIDTISSEVLTPFAEYYTPYSNTPSSGYGILTVEPDSILNGDELEYQAYNSFGKYSYVILDIELLPEDYVLTALTTFEDGSQEQYTLAMQEIKDIFNLD